LLYPVTRLAHPFLWALGGGLAIGLIDGAGCELSICRTFVFFPLFVAGYLLASEKPQWLSQGKARLGAASALVPVFVATYAISPSALEEWLLGCFSYQSMAVNRPLGLVMRLGAYVLTAAATAGIMALIPRRRFFFTRLGSRTLYIFLLHGFLAQLLLTAQPFRDVVSAGHYWLLAFVPLVFALVLASPPVVALTRPLIELKRPDWSWLPRRREPSSSAEAHEPPATRSATRAQ
jgi:fucose 4-O-acetylase-like acetyltransferase